MGKCPPPRRCRWVRASPQPGAPPGGSSPQLSPSSAASTPRHGRAGAPRGNSGGSAGTRVGLGRGWGEGGRDGAPRRGVQTRDVGVGARLDTAARSHTGANGAQVGAPGRLGATCRGGEAAPLPPSLITSAAPAPAGCQGWGCALFVRLLFRAADVLGG